MNYDSMTFKFFSLQIEAKVAFRAIKRKHIFSVTTNPIFE